MNRRQSHRSNIQQGETEQESKKKEGNYKLKRLVNIIIHVIICLNADTEEER